MPEKPSKPLSVEKDRDERVAIPLDPEEALKALLKVEPDRHDSPRSTQAPSRRTH